MKKNPLWYWWWFRNPAITTCDVQNPKKYTVLGPDMLPTPTGAGFLPSTVFTMECWLVHNVIVISWLHLLWSWIVFHPIGFFLPQLNCPTARLHPYKVGSRTRVKQPQLPIYFRPFYGGYTVTPFITIRGAHLVEHLCLQFLHRVITSTTHLFSAMAIRAIYIYISLPTFLEDHPRTLSG